MKRKVSDALIDRLAFMKDPMLIVDIATNIHHHEFPYIDNGQIKGWCTVLEPSGLE